MSDMNATGLTWNFVVQAAMYVPCPLLPCMIAVDRAVLHIHTFGRVVAQSASSHASLRSRG